MGLLSHPLQIKDSKLTLMSYNFARGSVLNDSQQNDDFLEKLEIWHKKTRVDQKLHICFPKKFFIGKNSTISDGLVQSALLAGGI